MKERGLSATVEKGIGKARETTNIDAARITREL